VCVLGGACGYTEESLGLFTLLRQSSRGCCVRPLASSFCKDAQPYPSHNLSSKRFWLLLNPLELNLRAFEGNAFRECFLEFFYFYIHSPPPSRPRVHDANRPLLVAWRCQNHFPFLSFHPVVDVKTHVARVVRIPRVSKIPPKNNSP
jgi:hypothetical protein